QAQCEEAVKKAALQEMGDAQYIKDFSITLEKGVNETTTGMVKFNVLLNSRNHYKFNVANGLSNPDDIIMQLYDKDKLLSSNLDGGKKYKGFEFICRATKVYQLVFSFSGGEEGCAEAVLSLVKQYSEGEMGF
ncbi:hypothetical protein, partial [Geofilum rubicundum]|uniref:hypothetical protein n=1 Tax=Geofilum rubicundum TaxID=472113 RepID=UPI0007821691